MTDDAVLHLSLQGSRVADLVASPPPSPDPVDLAALADAVARDGVRHLATFTAEELAATTPHGVDLPPLPPDGWLDGLDEGTRRAALAAATRSLAARGLLTATGGHGQVHGDLRLVHELRAAAPTVVQVVAQGEVDGRTRRVHHLLCRAHPGLVLHLAGAGGVVRATLRDEAAAGLALATVVADLGDVGTGDAPAGLPDPLAGDARDRGRRAIDGAASALRAAAHHRLTDGRVAVSHVALWRTELGPVLWTASRDDRSTTPPDPDHGRLHLVDATVAVAVCVGLLQPALPEETR